MSELKVYLKSKPQGNIVDETQFNYLTIDKCYIASLTPLIIDPRTFQPVDPSYLIRCDDGNTRKFWAKHFLTQEEWVIIFFILTIHLNYFL